MMMMYTSTSDYMQVSSTSRRQAYTAGEKLAVVKYAEAHGNRAASRHFVGINEANIRLWCKQKEHLQQMPCTKSANRGRQSAYPELEAKLLEWITDLQQQGIGVSVIEVRLKAKQLAGEMAQSSAFKASYGWARKFMVRNHLFVRRRRTTRAQRLPDDHTSKTANFQQFVIGLRRQYSYTSVRIIFKFLQCSMSSICMPNLEFLASTAPSI